MWLGKTVKFTENTRNWRGQAIFCWESPSPDCLSDGSKWSLKDSVSGLPIRSQSALAPTLTSCGVLDKVFKHSLLQTPHLPK